MLAVKGFMLEVLKFLPKATTPVEGRGEFRVMVPAVTGRDVPWFLLWLVPSGRQRPMVGIGFFLSMTSG